MPDNLQKRLISKKPFIILFFVISLITISGSIGIFQYEIRSIRNTKHNELSAIGQIKTREISNWVRERKSDVYSIAFSPLFSDAVNTWLENRNNIKLKNKIVERLQIVIDQHNYADILLVTPQGKILTTFESKSITLDPITVEKVAQACKDRRPQTTDFYYSRKPDRIHIDFIAPVRNDLHAPGAVLIMREVPDNFLYPLIQEWPLPSKTAETLVVRKEGDSVLFLNNLRHRANTALNLRIALNKMGLPAVQAIMGTTGVFEGRDYRNVPVLSHIGPVPETNWFMIAKIDQKEIYAEVNSRMRLMVIVIVILIVGIGFGMALVYNQRQRGMYRSLYLKEKEHDALLKEFRTTLYSIGDAVITTDRRGNIMFMNPVAEKMTGWQESEARGHNLTEVFIIINEEKRNSVTNPVERVLSEGLIIGLANHTLLISKDGQEIPISDSGAPIRNEKGEIIGVVLVFRDQTEERTVRKTLLDSENQFRSIWENSLDGMRLSDMNGIIRKVNRALCDLIGKTAEQLEGQPISVMYSTDSGPEILETFIERFHENSIVPYSEKLVNLVDGRSVWLELSNSLIIIKGEKLLLSIFRDITFRKLAEDRIRDSEERYRSTLDNMLEGAQIIGFDWRYIYLNKSAEKHGRQPKEELLGKRFMDCWPGAQETRLYTIMKKCLEQRIAEHLENEFRYPDGSSGWFELSIQPVKEGIFILSVDITVRKLAEEQIRYQANLLHNVSDAIIATDSDNIIRSWNPAAERIYGWKAEEVVGKKFRDVVQPEYKYHPREEVFKKIEKDGMWTGEIIHHNRLNENISILSTISILTDAAGLNAGLVSVNHDITDLKKAEDALIASERRYRLIAEHVGDIVWQLDMERCFVFISPAVGKVLGYSVEEILGKPVAGFMDDDGLTLMQRVIRERLSSPEKMPEPSEYRMRHKDGHWVDVEVVSSLIYDKDKNLIGFAGVTRDVTERKRMTAALNHSQEQLRQTQKLEALGQLASGIAHDFNNILAIILGHTYLMKSNLSDDIKLSHSIDTIEKTGQRGANLVKQLLTLARRNEPSITQVNLHELISDMVKMLSETFPKHISFETDVVLSLPYILADASQIHQVMMNLCVNARDAMPQGGTLRIAARRESGKAVRLKRTDANAAEYVALSISDTGIGMDQKTVTRIFEPFFTTKGPGKGTGLGLSTVHGIVANHNGFVEVDSQPSKGTTFTVFLPAPLETGELEAGEVQEINGLKGGNETILIIEDEDYIVELLNTVLNRYGYQTIIVRDGIAGVETYQRERDKIAIVISDIGLPRLTGDEVFKRIRGINPQAKVILASGFIDPETKSELFKTGLAGFMQKPFFPTLLLKTIREILDSE